MKTMLHTISFSRILALFLFLLPLPPAAAQTEPPPGQPSELTASGKCGGSGFFGLVKDVGSDYRNFFSKETAIWYGAGAAGTGLIHLADEDIREGLSERVDPNTTALKVGNTYGNLAFQLPLAVGWWAAGHAFGSSRAADAGRDLLRAQINSTTWTYIVKYAIHRERPNGDPRSFPSGHVSSTFATAMVLQQHYGWKVGVPFFLGAGYTAFTRINDDKHWASDVVFGAVIGMASARTVTLHLRKHKVTLLPVAVPGGGGLALVTRG